MNEGVREGVSVGDIHGTGRVSVSRHYNFLRVWTLFCYLTAQNILFIQRVRVGDGKGTRLKSLLRKYKKLSDRG